MELLDLLKSIPARFSLLDMHLSELSVFFVIWGVTLLLLFVLRKTMLIRIKKRINDSKTDRYIYKIISNIKVLFFVILSLYIATKSTSLNKTFDSFIGTVFMIAFIMQSAQFIQNVTTYGIRKFWNKGHDEEHNKTAINGLILFIKIVLWILALFLILSNLGFEVSTLVASLGISSIAIAFALQNILSDIFSSFTIYLDEPFKVGDTIFVGTDSGKVQKIGIKSTRIESPDGEEIIISNRELTSVRIKNYGKLVRRRVVQQIDVVYGTSEAKLKEIPAILKKIILSNKITTFDRVHFTTLGSYALTFELVYFVDSSDYNIYMDARNDINYKIIGNFRKKKISFAYPTQSVIVGK